MGFLFGAIMFVFMTLFFALTMSLSDPESGNFLENLTKPKLLLINLGAWTIGGFLFGFGMKYVLGPKSPLMKSKPGKAA